jgi:dienelactone hydrolase
MTDNDLLLTTPGLEFGSGVIGVCDVCGRRQAVIVLEKERYQLCVLDFLNKSWLGSTAIPGRPVPPYRSERVRFATDATPTGGAPGVLLTPTKPVRHPGVLVTPDVYGLTTLLLDGGVRLARAGFEVLLPDVGKLDGISPVDHLALRADARLRGGVRVASARAQKFVRLYLDALEYLRARPLVDPTKIGLFGASFGGSFALAVAGEDRGISAAGIAFPLPLRPAEFLRTINAPVFVLAGTADAAAQRAAQQLVAMLPADPPVVVRSVPGAAHLFLARDHRGYNVATAESAWSELLTFFRDRLLPPPPKPPVPPVSRTAPPPPVGAAPTAAAPPVLPPRAPAPSSA